MGRSGVFIRGDQAARFAEISRQTSDISQRDIGWPRPSELGRQTFVLEEVHHPFFIKSHSLSVTECDVRREDLSDAESLGSVDEAILRVGGLDCSW